MGNAPEVSGSLAESFSGLPAVKLVGRSSKPDQAGLVFGLAWLDLAWFRH